MTGLMLRVRQIERRRKENEMKDRPILFTGEMVRAILGGRKTQTRRVIKLPRWATCWEDVELDDNGLLMVVARDTTCLAEIHCTYGQPGDRLWVKETWALAKEYDRRPGSRVPKKAREKIWYLANGEKPDWAGRTRTSRYMPRWASRITLEIVNVRVERVQDISYEECCLETGSPVEWLGSGPEPYRRDMRKVFELLWNSINAKRGFGWDVNPWVRVIKFKRVEER